MSSTVDNFSGLPNDCKERIRTLYDESSNGQRVTKNYIYQLLGEVDEFLPDNVLEKLSATKKLIREKKIDKEEFTKRLLGILSCYEPTDDAISRDEEKENVDLDKKVDEKPVKELETKKGKTPPRNAKVRGQHSITSMFESMAAKRKSSGGEESSAKKTKSQSSDWSASSSLTRCANCRQYLDEELKAVQLPPDGKEEFVTLTLPELSVFEDNSSALTDERPQHKITDFSVYGKCGHLCAFDAGLIESGKELFFCGYVKPIYSDDAGVKGGIATVKMGPINEWYVHGFDGHSPVIGFSTAFAEYFLMKPSKEYAPYMDVVQEKAFMSNLVISFLIDNGTATYEDLLNKLAGHKPDARVRCPLTEETLLRDAQFVCDQVQSFDNTADDDEDLLLHTPCMRSLVRLAGVTLGNKTKTRKKMVEPVKKQDKGHATMSLATTTPLVRNVFNNLFRGEIDETSHVSRRRRCGQCEICQQPDCGVCMACKNKAKYDGEGKSKQACLKKRCPNMAIASAADNEEEEDEMDKKAKTASESRPKRKIKTKRVEEEVKLIGEGLGELGSNVYYGKIEVRGVTYCVGDYVAVADVDPDVEDICKIVYIWKDKRGDGFVHAHWFTRAYETVLGETADPTELFLVDECDNIPPDSIKFKVSVSFKAPSKSWFEMGGLEDGISPVPENAVNTYFYQKWYDSLVARFEDIPVVADDGESLAFCPCCTRLAEAARKERMIVGNVLEYTGKKTLYESVEYQGHKFKVGSCCFIDPETYSYKYKRPRKSTAPKELDSKYDDDILYPETYRKQSKHVKGSNDECPDPFLIGRVLEIFKRDFDDEENVKLRIAKFYRPENTHLSDREVQETDLNLLYWSEEESTVPLSKTNGGVDVYYIARQDPSLLFQQNKFYFREAYDGEEKVFTEPPSAAKSYKMAKAIHGGEKNDITDFKKLRCLDVFAGCGGLSAGLHQCGVAETRWAIEKVDAAAKAYGLNSKNCTVFTDDCNELLKLVIQGSTHNKEGKALPMKGDVEMLCGGPPCQGFSGMNRFNSREYSRFKNSLIASYLSYCDYYRPRFFVLENVRNFVSYKNGMVLKMALRCLVAMGYQCTFGVLQAGCYGVAQTRRRAIILAAAPGEKLPFYPEPLHVFSPKTMQLSVVINEFKYKSNIKYEHSAPYRTITVRDCMSDLPEIGNGHRKSNMDYGRNAATHFQRLIRGDETKLKDHVCKEMNPLVAARMAHVPISPGSDWRLLPNIKVKLTDGTVTKVLKYTHKDSKHGRSPSGAHRGVCCCATRGEKCDPEFRQFNTLIPWCLPHTGNRHNNWAGLYGRLEWDGFFSTTVTNPEPMGKQGRVLHPEQHRVVSVRECARSQGFPDSFVFYGTIVDKHRQVGNAVPPPLGKAIGEEVKKSILAKER